MTRHPRTTAATTGKKRKAIDTSTTSAPTSTQTLTQSHSQSHSSQNLIKLPTNLSINASTGLIKGGLGSKNRLIGQSSAADMAATAAALRSLGASIVRSPGTHVTHVVVDRSQVQRVRLGQILDMVGEGGGESDGKALEKAGTGLSLEGGKKKSVVVVDLEWAQKCVETHEYVDITPYIVET